MRNEANRCKFVNLQNTKFTAVMVRSVKGKDITFMRSQMRRIAASEGRSMGKAAKFKSKVAAGVHERLAAVAAGPTVREEEIAKRTHLCSLQSRKSHFRERHKRGLSAYWRKKYGLPTFEERVRNYGEEPLQDRACQPRQDNREKV